MKQQYGDTDFARLIPLQWSDALLHFTWHISVKSTGHRDINKSAFFLSRCDLPPSTNLFCPEWGLKWVWVVGLVPGENFWFFVYMLLRQRGGRLKSPWTLFFVFCEFRFAQKSKNPAERSTGSPSSSTERCSLRSDLNKKVINLWPFFPDS